MADKKQKNIGIKVPFPKNSCKDPLCPFHGRLKLRGRTFVGTVIRGAMQKTATIGWEYPFFLPKFERSETRKTKIHAHNPECIDADIGDKVKVAECRQLSKTKSFVIIQNLGKEKGFIEKLEAEEEAQEVIDKKETKEEAEEKGGKEDESS
ncbi:30S ribosomal protein S17 [Candidatus Woesearchaeota archaeon]|nr:30S ribosomal protein S17 [Candidatus Woesearchaeota archaeon]